MSQTSGEHERRRPAGAPSGTGRGTGSARTPAPRRRRASTAVTTVLSVEHDHVEGDDVPVAGEAQEEVVGGLRVHPAELVAGGQQRERREQPAEPAVGEVAGGPQQHDRGEDVGQVVDDVVQQGAVEPGDGLLDPELAGQHPVGAVDEEGGQAQPEGRDSTSPSTAASTISRPRTDAAGRVEVDGRRRPAGNPARRLAGDAWVAAPGPSFSLHVEEVVTPARLGSLDEREAGKVRVAVVFGGRSAEHAISCVSAGSVMAALDPERYEVVPVGIATDGRWVLGRPRPAAGRSPTASCPRSTAAPRSRSSATRPAAGWPSSSPAPRSAAALDRGRRRLPASCTAPTARTAPSRGCWRWPGCPTSGSGVFASAASMDKEFTKKLLARPGLPQGDHVVLRDAPARCGRPALLDDAARERLGLPVFVKPARAGSSIGITRVTDWAQFPAAVADAAAVDPKVIVEAAVPGREIECGVLAGPDGRRPRPACPRRSGCGRAPTGTTSRPSTSTTPPTSTSRPTCRPSRPRRCRRPPAGPSWRWTAAAWPASTSSSARHPTAATGW